MRITVLQSAIAIVSLVCMQTAYTQGHQVTGTCGKEESRKTAVDASLAAVGCDNYACGKVYITSFYLSYNQSIYTACSFVQGAAGL